MTRIFFFSVVPQGFRKKHIHEDCNSPAWDQWSISIYKTHLNLANTFDHADNTCAGLRKTRLGQHWVNSEGCRTQTVKLTLWEQEGNVSYVEELDQERSGGFSFYLVDRDKWTCYSSINRTLSDRL